MSPKNRSRDEHMVEASQQPTKEPPQHGGDKQGSGCPPDEIQSILNDPETGEWISKGKYKASLAGGKKVKTTERESVVSIMEDPEIHAWLVAKAPKRAPAQLGRAVQYALDDEGNQIDLPTTAAHREDPHPPTLSRTTRLQQESMPGAFHAGGDLSISLDDHSAPQLESLANATQAVESLAMARAIADEAQELPQAELREQGEDTSSTKRKPRAPVVLAIVIGVLVLIIAMALTTEERTVNDSDHHYFSLAPSSSPSLAPTSLESYLLSLLPDYTLESIQDPESAQTRAFQWLVDDMEYNLLLSDKRIVQRFSLASLYFSTGGEGWRENYLWLNHTAHECDWHNNEDFAMKGYLSTILGKGYMSEMFPPPEPQPAKCNETSELFQHLWLDQNNLNGPIPLELYLLTTLQTLSLGVYNKLQGPLSSHIGQLAALEGFVLENLENNGVIETSGPIPSQIGLLTRLKALSLSGNKHTGTIPSQLGLLSNLQTLSLVNRKPMPDKLPDLRLFPKLRWLLLHGNELSGTIPTQIGLITTLEFVTAGDNNLSGTIPSQMGLLSNMGMFSAYFNQLEGTLPTQLGLMTAASLLSFRGNLVSGTIPSQLGMLGNLSVALSLHDNPTLTGTIPTELGLLSNLYRLVFTNNNHTGPIPSEFGMLQSLGQVWFGNNSLSGTIPAALGSLWESLYAFEVDGNPLLSGTLPARLCNMNGTCVKHFLRSDCMEGTLLAFNCTDLLCGCNCPCAESDLNSTI